MFTFGRVEDLLPVLWPFGTSEQGALDGITILKFVGQPLIFREEGDKFNIISTFL